MRPRGEPSAPRARTLAKRFWILPAAFTGLVVIAVVINVPDRLPDAVWSHPGDPWCDACRRVPSYTFSVAPGGPPLDLGWCFTSVDRGIQLGPADTPLVSLLNSIEMEFQNGEHSYRGGGAYARTGRTESIDGHTWSEYRRADAP